VIPADTIVVQLDRIAFLATDRDGRAESVEDASPIRSVQHSQGDCGHGSFGAAGTWDMGRDRFDSPYGSFR
jgi:hypothetical protein